MSASSRGVKNNGEKLTATRCGLLFLPPELLYMVLSRVRLHDLVNLRQVCHRLREIVEGGGGGDRLWATVSLDNLSVDSHHLPLIERAADCGNREALIKLAMAFLYNQGVPKGEGAGTLDSWNGTRAAELLLKLDAMSPNSRPVSWFLIRPPWSTSVSNKVCAHHKMVEQCLNQQNLAVDEEERNKESNSSVLLSGISYNLGRIANFLKLDGKMVEDGQTAIDWFNRGASNGCPFSALEVWRRTMKPNLAVNEVPAVRSLRKIITMGNQTSIIDSKLELCNTYASGHYGSVCREEALLFVREMMSASQPSLRHRIFLFQHDITHIMRFITVDWMIEIAELKNLSRHTLHQAVALFDAYLLSRQVDRSSLQLLGVTAILIASRWSGTTMLTIRESSWLTENTYSYEEVVKMMAELLGTFQGDIQRLTISDYLEVLLTLVEANSMVQSMASYLSEAVLLHLDLTTYSSAQLAASCLLTAQILLRQDYPWPAVMEQSSGFSLSTLSSSCLLIYKKCLTKEFTVADHRGVELCAIFVRYSHQSHNSISKHEIMALEEFSEQLGVTSDLSSTPPQSPARKQGKDKLLSFLSDSCYLSSPHWFSGSESSECDSVEDKEREELVADGNSRNCGSISIVSSSPSISNEALSPVQDGEICEELSSSKLPLSTPNHHRCHLSISSPLYHQDHLTVSDSNLTQGTAVSLPQLKQSQVSESLNLVPNLSLNSKPISSGASLVPLSHHQSFVSCNSETYSFMLSQAGKTERAHVSCPDFHSYSTNEMELGTESTDEEMEVECSTRTTLVNNIQKPYFHQSDYEEPDLHLPPLSVPHTMPSNALDGSRNSPGRATPLNSTTKNHSLTFEHKYEKRSAVAKSSPVGGLENMANSVGLPKNKIPSVHRNPLQSLTNTPRQQGSKYKHLSLEESTHG